MVNPKPKLPKRIQDPKISIKKETKAKLDKLKLVDRDTYDDIINRYFCLHPFTHEEKDKYLKVFGKTMMSGEVGGLNPDEAGKDAVVKSRQKEHDEKKDIKELKEELLK